MNALINRFCGKTSPTGRNYLREETIPDDTFETLKN